MKYLLPILTLCLLGLSDANSQVYNQWIKKSDFAGMKRSRAVGFSIGNMGFLCSGTDTSETIHNDLWAYDPATDTWTQRANLPGSVRRNAVATVVGNVAYVGTGVDSSSAQAGNILKDWWAYNAVSNSWTQKADYPGGGGNGVYHATAFTQNGLAYVCSGKIAPATYMAELWAYDPTLDHWYRFSDFPGGDRHKLASVTIGDTAYVGLGTDDDVYRKDWWAYHAFIDAWEQRTDFPGGDRASVSTFSVLERGYLCLGENGGFKKDLWEYDPRYDQWTNRANFEGQERRYAIAFSIGDKAYVGTGQGASGKKRSFYEYRPAYLSQHQESSFKAKIFPNPCQTNCHIELFENGIYTLEIFDHTGKRINEIQFEGRHYNLHVHDYQRGIYTLRVSDNNKTMTQKIVVQ